MAFAALSGNTQADVAAQTASKRAIEVREGGLPLQLGSQGPLVAQVQNALGIPADGIFGLQTDAAVRRYQARAGVQVDGVVGPVTWAALFPPTAAGSGGDAPPAVKQRLERELREAGARLDAQADRSVDELFGSVARAEGSSRHPDDPVVSETPSREGSSVPKDPASGDQSQEPSADEGPEQSEGDRQPSQQVDTSCGSSTLTSPVKGTVTSGFGPRWGRNHDGVDIAAPTGTAIRAAACGSVTIAGVQSGYGNIVCITHSSRFATCYAHMSRFAVSQGARVTAGQVIGYVGCTGSCTGPHLHFETRVNGQAQDPSPYLNGSRAASASAAGRSTAHSGAAGGPRGATTTSRGGATAVGGGSTARLSWSGSGSAPAAPESVSSSGQAAQVTVGPTATTSVPGDGVTPAQPVAPAQPVEPVALPVEPAPVPVEPAPVPVEPVAAPVEPAPVPVEPVAAPVEPAPVPVEPAPVEPAPMPVEPVAAPVEPTPAPVEAAPAPAEPPAAQLATTESAAAASAPVDPAATPAEVAPAPVETPATPAQ